jgi:hypothetical protein
MVGKLRQHMFQEVKSELTQGHGVSIILKENVHPKKFIGLHYDENNQGLILFIYFYRLCNA